jgi:streptogramin lyase
MVTINPITVSGYISDPISIFAGPSDVWMIDYTGFLHQITTPGLAQSSFSSSSDSNDGCYGPDGNYWITSSFGGGRFAKINASSHAITYYSGSPATQGTCVGPDGNIWGVAYAHVYAINTSGTSVHSTAISGANLRRICVGPDGNMWACDSINGKIYKIITSTGVASLVATVSGTAYDICSGSDGNLWVACLSSHGVSQVTPTGVTTFFALSGGWTGTSAPWGICPGPDGNLWVADYGAALWSVTTAGVGTSYEVATLNHAYPNEICPGGDGSLYVSDAYVSGGSNTVWQVTFPSPPPVGGWHLGSIVWK